MHAQERTPEKFQILASKVNSTEDIVVATGNVVIFSPTYYILAKKAVYDRKNQTFELFDDVVILQDNNVLAQSNYAFLDIKKEQLIQNPIFVLNSQSSVWITSKDLAQDKNIFMFNDSILSSCDCTDPFWSIRFTEGEYDKEDKWIDTYNTRLYIKDIPLLYTPYFGFSTDNTRRTGFLPATVGYSGSEGFVYEQPIFIAPADNYDIELVPEIRTQRGHGMYAYYRLADSAYSQLNIKTGIWEEKSDYYKEESLENKKHYGYNINYERTKLFSKNKEDEDGLFVDIHWMNDVEYRNLRDDGEPDDEKIESKINYYFDTPKYYFGTYLRYYLDTSKGADGKQVSNDSTLQQLPQVQVHKYSEPLLFDEIMYSSDFTYTNRFREDDLNANRYELTVPLSYSFYMFDDFLNITLKEELTAIKQTYSNGNKSFDDATFFENRHIISASTDLVKKYDSLLHTVNLEGSFVIPNQFGVDGDTKIDLNPNDKLTPNDFTISETAKSMNFSLNQSLYSNEDLEQIINHKLSQAVVYDEFDNSKLGNMENELTINYLFGTIYNKLLYSHLDDELIENSSSFSFDYLNYFLKLSYYMSQETKNSDKEDLESYTVDIGYNFLRDYTVSYYEKYNIEDQLRSKQGVVFSVTDRCWDLNVRYEKEIEASSSTVSSTIEQDIVYLELVLKPLGQINQKYKVKDSNN